MCHHGEACTGGEQLQKLDPRDGGRVEKHENFDQICQRSTIKNRSDQIEAPLEAVREPKMEIKKSHTYIHTYIHTVKPAYSDTQGARKSVIISGVSLYTESFCLK